MIDAVLPDHSQKAISSVLKGALSKEDVLLCTDGDPALIAFAKSEGLEYELIIASKGEHVHERVLHIQNVNSYMSGLKKWLARFNGVATKYLQNYLGWRRMLEKSGAAITPESCLAAATPCDEMGEAVEVRTTTGEAVEGFHSAGAYKSIADQYDRVACIEPTTVIKPRAKTFNTPPSSGM